MSVKFEKETVRETNMPGGRRHDLAHEIGEKFTGGKGQTGYLAVRSSPALLPSREATKNDAMLITCISRPTSSSSRAILCARRCSHPAVSPRYRKCSRRGSRTTKASMATTSARGCRRWPPTALSSVRRWAISSSASCRDCLLAGPV